jgi:hypothetical protein
MGASPESRNTLGYDLDFEIAPLRARNGVDKEALPLPRPQAGP